MLISALLLSFLVNPGSTPKYKIEFQPGEHVKVVYFADFQTSGTGTLVEANFVAAIPPEGDWQRNVKVSWAKPVGAETIIEQSPLQRKLLQLRLNNIQGAVTMPFELRYEADLTIRKLVPLKRGEKAPSIQQLSEKEIQYFTAETKIHDFEHPNFVRWMKQYKYKRNSSEDELAFAQRVFLQFTKTMTYQLHKQDLASILCKETQHDCDSSSNLYVSVMRANGIPARMVAGMPMKDRTAVNGSIGGHIVVEIFISDIGWIPIDPSSGITHKNKNPLSAFGYANGKFLVFMVDYQLQIPRTDGSFRSLGTLSFPNLATRAKGDMRAKYTHINLSVEASKK